MTFIQKIENDKYIYTTEDIFGTIEIVSDYIIDPKLLDDLVVLLLRQNSASKTITGEVKMNEGIVKYSFKKEAQWSEDDDDEEEKCENLPI